MEIINVDELINEWKIPNIKDAYTKKDREVLNDFLKSETVLFTNVSWKEIDWIKIPEFDFFIDKFKVSKWTIERWLLRPWYWINLTLIEAAPLAVQFAQNAALEVSKQKKKNWEDVTVSFFYWSDSFQPKVIERILWTEYMKSEQSTSKYIIKDIWKAVDENWKVEEVTKVSEEDDLKFELIQTLKENWLRPKRWLSYEELKELASENWIEV